MLVNVVVDKIVPVISCVHLNIIVFLVLLPVSYTRKCRLKDKSTIYVLFLCDFFFYFLNKILSISHLQK